MKVKLIDVLNMIEDKSLEDDERVIIDNSFYYYNEENKKFYTVPKSECRNTYRNISTNELDLECELIDRNVIELNVKDIGLTVPTEEIEELEYDHNFYSQTECSLLKNEDAKKAYLLKGIHESIDLSLKNKNKINELVREVNCLKRNKQC